jgi:hypothetical protein
VDSSDTASWNNKRPCGVAFGFQASETSVDPHSDESINVFSNDPRGSDFANNSKHLKPEARTLAGQPDPFPRLADVLTGKSTGNEGSCFSISVSVNCSNIIKNRHPRPVSCQYLLAVFVLLAEAYGFKACPFCGKVNASGQMPENNDKCVSRVSGIMRHLRSAKGQSDDDMNGKYRSVSSQAEGFSVCDSAAELTEW